MFFGFMHGSGQAGSVKWNTVAGKLIGFLPFFLSYQLAFDVFFCFATFVLGL